MPTNNDMTMVTLAMLAESEVGAQWEHAFTELLKNVMDPNTPETDTRKLTLKLVFKPDEDRASGKIGCQVTMAPAGLNPVVIKGIHLGMSDGKLVAATFDPKQHQMFDNEDGTVLPITHTANGGDDS